MPAAPNFLPISTTTTLKLTTLTRRSVRSLKPQKGYRRNVQNLLNVW
jgi:hypothetical protein